VTQNTSTPRATELLRVAPVIDGHNDLPWALRTLLGSDPRAVAAGIDLAEPQPSLHTDLGRLRSGGVGGQFWSVFVPCELTGSDAVTAVLEQIELVHALIARYPDDLALATTAEDVEAAIAAGRVASLLGAEGGHCIAESLGVLRALHRLGVRYLTLTHNKNTPWADSATDDPAAGGLTDFGREVVREINRLGMLVDLSHVAPTTMRDALDASTAPVIFSHSSCRAVYDHPRNVPDDVLAALADNGGVCMVTFVGRFITGEPEATLDDVVAHVEHAREIAGLDHIGLGGDYDGTTSLPVGMEDVGAYPLLFEALLDRGWTGEECAKLAGRNIVRVLREAQAHAAISPLTGKR
jgi:membrane dipeptidase